MQTQTMGVLTADARSGEDAEAALLRRAAARDEQAVKMLYRTHFAKVHRRVARILGAHDPEVEDVVQNVFIAALGAAARFDGRSSVGTWLLGIATRRALDQARVRWRKGRWQRMGEAVGIGRAPAAPDVQHAALDQAQAALERLSPEQRVVFLLHDVEGHTFAEIKELTGAGISTLHARLKSARKRLDAVVAEWTGEGRDHG